VANLVGLSPQGGPDNQGGLDKKADTGRDQVVVLRSWGSELSHGAGSIEPWMFPKISVDQS